MRTIVALAIVGAVGCDSSQVVRQNGLVPRPHPDTYDGQPMQHAVQIEGHGESTVVAPTSGTDATNGATVARSELGGAIRFGAGPGDVGLLFDYALTGGATSTNNQNPVPPPSEQSFGIGLAVRRSIPIGEPGDRDGWRIGVAGTFTAWTISRREEGGSTGVNEAPVFSFSVVPSKRFGNVVGFGSLTVMNQIRVPATFVDATGNDQGTDPASAGGGGVAILGLGARIDIADGFSFVVQASQTLGAQGDDVPMFGGAILIGAGTRPDLRPAPPPMYPPPPPYGQPPMYPPPYGQPPPPYGQPPPPYGQPPYTPPPPPYAPPPPAPAPPPAPPT